jgi:hypothetical protein
MFSKLDDDEDCRRDRYHDQQDGEGASNPHQWEYRDGIIAPWRS